MEKTQIKIARQLHEWYLEAITNGVAGKQYNPNAVKPYDELTPEQKAIDLYIASKLLSWHYKIKDMELNIEERSREGIQMLDRIKTIEKARYKK